MTTSPLDPNIHPHRPDLAAESLRGLVEAARFAPGQAHQVSAGVASVRKAPAPDAEQISQALHGEAVAIYEERDGFGWGQMASDGYVGWFDMAALSAPPLAPTHKVTALRTYALSGPSARAPAHFLLSLEARVVATGDRENGFTRCERAGWVPDVHLGPPDAFAPDPVAVAERFVGAPYQWGGKESLGLDCSGLVQIAFAAAGMAIPRDSYMQRELGEAVPVGPDLQGLRRGDLVCWKGHVALMVDAHRIIHANGFHMATVIEPLAEAEKRIASTYGPMLTVRRLGLAAR
jgi:cell wall-associated NlpC family hydrolase